MAQPGPHNDPTIDQHPLAPCQLLHHHGRHQRQLPPGVSATRISPWVLPSVPDDQRLRLRPDLLIFEGLTSTDKRLPSLTTRATPNLRSLQRGVTIHIIELTFTSHHDNALTDKMQQHTLLVSLLQAAGWAVKKKKKMKPLGLFKVQG